MFIRWCFSRILYFDVQTGTKTNKSLFVYVHGMVLLNRHHNKPIFSCLCLWGGSFARILYFGVQTGTKTSLFLVVKVYGMVLLLPPCPSMYKQAPNQTNFLVVYVFGVVLLLASCSSMYKQAPKQTYLYLFMFTGWCFDSNLVLWCTNRHQNKPIFSCLCLLGGAFTRILYFDVQTSTKTNLSLVVYVYGMVLLLTSCTSVFKQAPKQTYLAGI